MKEKIAFAYHTLLALFGVHMYAPCRTDDGHLIDLIRPTQYDRLPSGAILISTTGEVVRKDHHKIDGDTRNGFIAYGLPSSRGTMRGYYGRLRTQ